MLSKKPPGTTGPSFLRQNLLAAIGTAAAYTVRYLLDPLVADRLPYAAFLFPVAWLAVICGPYSAAVCLVAGAFLGSYSFVLPRYSLSIHGAEIYLSMTAYLIIGALLIAAIETQRRARLKAEKAEAASRTALQAAEQLEERLSASEALYRASFDRAAIGIAHMALDGRWIRFNDRVCEITGYSREELNQMTFADITHPDDLAPDWDLARRLAAGEIPQFSMEKRYLRPSGDPVWVNLTASMVRDAAGVPQHYISIIEEIDARKKTESALRASERYLTSVLESITDAVSVVDADWKFAYVNGAWEKTGGFERDAIVGRHVWELFPDARGSSADAQLQRAARDRVPVQFETRYEPWDRWFAVRAYPREAGGLIIYSRDITAEKDAAKALSQSEQRYRSLVLATSAFIWTADANGAFTTRQPGWEEYTGQTQEQYTNGKWIAAVHPEDRARVAEAWRKAQSSRSIYEVEWRAWHDASGNWRHCQTRGIPIIGDNGEVQEWVAAVTDVHDRKLLEAQLQRDDKLDSLGVLAGGVAHDFNNLLVGVLGNAALAREAASPELRGYLAHIEAAAERGAALTRQMLAYAGKQQFVFGSLDLSSEVREVLALVRSSLHPSINLVLDLDDQLPPVKADQGQIQQVVMNLLINAGEAISSQGGRVRIATATDPERRWVSLTVEDNGCGMKPDVKARIFDPFFTTKFTGRGLGLAAVMGIVRAHQGTITVESAPGCGAMFQVRFPAAEHQQHPASKEAVTALPSTVAATVLVIDDESVVRKVAHYTLQRIGAQVLLADSGHAGIELFRTRAAEIDVVLLDASMPDLGGREVLRELRAIRPDLPVLTSSGHPASEMERYFAGDQPVGFLQKPYKPDALIAAVSALLENRARQQSA